MANQPTTRTAAHGQKMIEVEVRFWTNELADGSNRIRPKHAWDGGVVLVKPNAAHGIQPQNPVPFNGMAELPSKIEKVLIAQGITLHLSRRASRYMVPGH